MVVLYIGVIRVGEYVEWFGRGHFDLFDSLCWLRFDLVYKFLDIVHSDFAAFGEVVLAGSDYHDLDAGEFIVVVVPKLLDILGGHEHDALKFVS